jgi:hypothetical protein
MAALTTKLKWQRANAAIHRRSSREWRERNLASSRAASNRWNAAHREEQREYMRSLRRKNPNIDREYRERKAFRDAWAKFTRTCAESRSIKGGVA